MADLPYIEQMQLILSEKVNNGRSDQAITFLKTLDLIKKEMNCESCRNIMNWEEDKTTIDGYKWRCRSSDCLTVDIRCNSIFTSVSMNLPQWIIAMFFWSRARSVENTIYMNGTFFEGCQKNLKFAFIHLRIICVKYFQNNLNEQLGGEKSLILIDQNFNEGQLWHIFKRIQGRVLCIIDWTAKMGYLEIIKYDYETTMDSIIKRVVAKGSTIRYTNRSTGEYVHEAESYRNRFYYVAEALQYCYYENDLNSYFKQIMWLDRFGGDNAFLTLCDHINFFL